MEFRGSSPNIFVGRFGYPKVGLSLISPNFQTKRALYYDSPKDWSKDNLSIKHIINLRSKLYRSSSFVDINSSTKYIELAKEIAASSKPVDIDVNLEKEPIGKSYSNWHLPFGPIGKIKKVELASSPNIDSRVERIISDTDCKAVTGTNELYQKGFDELFLTKLLSSGNLGVNRKIVPTRWSITAVDDTLSKKLISEVSINDTISPQVYRGEYLGNYFFILFFEGAFAFELFEWYKGSITTDYETHFGRTEYAKNCAGGYYAVRLPVLEKLKSLRKVGNAIAVRIITEEYSTPLGVFVVREAARKSLSEKPLEFSSKELALQYIKLSIKRKIGIDLELTKSKLITGQKSLSYFSK
jgi:DNA repair protein NreA